MSSNSPWLEKAYTQLGQEEIYGSGANPRILQYHQVTTLGALTDETPWCAAFVCWCLPDHGTKSAWARSFLRYGKELHAPVLGCIVVLSRGVDSGHVGFYVGERAGRILLLGGNQSNKVCIQDYGKERVLGYRWPDLSNTTLETPVSGAI